MFTEIKPWTADEVETLRRMAEQGATAHELSAETGRSVASRQTKAAKLKLYLVPSRTGSRRWWTESKTAVLREMAADGSNAREIASVVVKTRNSVIGKAYRLVIEWRESKRSASARPRRPAAERTAPMKPAKQSPAVPVAPDQDAPPPVQCPAAPAPCRVVRRQRSKAPTQGPAAPTHHAPPPAPHAAIPAPTASCHFRTRGHKVVETPPIDAASNATAGQSTRGDPPSGAGGGVSIWAVGPFQCRWPLTEVLPINEFRFCGARATLYGYCAKHKAEMTSKRR